jgi:gluconate 2-dehydrogenase gamma chain
MRRLAMRKTRTLDTCPILEGEITLVPEKQEVSLKAVNTVVQRGTNHARLHRSDQPCTIAFSSHAGKFWDILPCAVRLHREITMKNDGINRREFLKGAVAGGAVATTAAVGLTATAQAQQKPAAAASANPGYSFLNLEEAAFVEAVVDHMVPADEYSPQGTDMGINIYIDRSLAGGWGKGDRLYMQGPWKTGHPNQGYQLPLKPSELYRAGIAATNAYCKKTYSKSFDQLPQAQKQEVLVGLQGGKINFEGGLPARTFFATMYQTVIEGM